MLKNTHSTYGSLTKWLHWGIALIVISLLSGSFFLDDITDKTLQGQLITLHKSLGLTVLAFMLIRVVWRLMNPQPALPNTLPNWQKYSARFLHFLLYIALITMAVIGWVMSTAGKDAPNFWWLIKLPAPFVPINDWLSNTAFHYHVVFAWILIALISLHTIAALKHHYWHKDGVLKRMLPGKCDQ